MKILVLGASGQLGQCIKRVALEMEFEQIYFPEENFANILDPEALDSLFKEIKPNYVINCAAYTAVDKAEDDIELCRNINAAGVINVATLCKHHASILVHISTDFVFKGDTPGLLNENDPTEPINMYGKTKLEGEKAVSRHLDEHFIIRTSWLYSEYANNFVKTMLRLGKDNDQLNVIADQIGTPTYAIDLARTILSIIKSNIRNYGIYHYSNEGVTSWFDFAVAIFELSGIDVRVRPIPTSQYPTKAERPKFSVMDKTKIKETFNLDVPYWRVSLNECILRLKNN